MFVFVVVVVFKRCHLKHIWASHGIDPDLAAGPRDETVETIHLENVMVPGSLGLDVAADPRAETVCECFTQSSYARMERVWAPGGPSPDHAADREPKKAPNVGPAGF